MRALQAKVKTEAEAKKTGRQRCENHAEAVKFSSVREGFAGESGNRSGSEKNSTATVRKSRQAVKFSSVHEGFAGESGYGNRTKAQALCGAV